jgi:hypothetical protein
MEATNQSLSFFDVVFVCLQLDPRFAGSNHAETMVFLRAIKIRNIPSFGLEVKPEVTCRKVLRHVKVPLTYQRY